MQKPFVNNRFLTRKWKENENMELYKKIKYSKPEVKLECPESFTFRKNFPPQTLDAREAEIRRRNKILVEKICSIYDKRNEQAANKSADERDQPLKSLNGMSRKQEIQRITHENFEMSKRIVEQKASYDRKKWENDFSLSNYYMKNICEYPQQQFEKPRDIAVDLMGSTGNIANCMNNSHVSNTKNMSMSTGFMKNARLNNSQDREGIFKKPIEEYVSHSEDGPGVKTTLYNKKVYLEELEECYCKIYIENKKLMISVQSLNSKLGDAHFIIFDEYEEVWKLCRGFKSYYDIASNLDFKDGQIQLKFANEKFNYRVNKIEVEMRYKQSEKNPSRGMTNLTTEKTEYNENVKNEKNKHPHEPIEEDKEDCSNTKYKNETSSKPSSSKNSRTRSMFKNDNTKSDNVNNTFKDTEHKNSHGGIENDEKYKNEFNEIINQIDNTKYEEKDSSSKNRETDENNNTTTNKKITNNIVETCDDEVDKMKEVEANNLDKKKNQDSKVKSGKTINQNSNYQSKVQSNIQSPQTASRINSVEENLRSNQTSGKKTLKSIKSGTKSGKSGTKSGKSIKTTSVKVRDDDVIDDDNYKSESILQNEEEMGYNRIHSPIEVGSNHNSPSRNMKKGDIGRTEETEEEVQCTLSRDVEIHDDGIGNNQKNKKLDNNLKILDSEEMEIDPSLSKERHYSKEKPSSSFKDISSDIKIDLDYKDPSSNIEEEQLVIIKEKIKTEANNEEINESPINNEHINDDSPIDDLVIDVLSENSEKNEKVDKKEREKIEKEIPSSADDSPIEESPVSDDYQIKDMPHSDDPNESYKPELIEDDIVSDPVIDHEDMNKYESIDDFKQKYDINDVNLDQIDEDVKLIRDVSEDIKSFKSENVKSEDINNKETKPVRVKEIKEKSDDDKESPSSGDNPVHTHQTDIQEEYAEKFSKLNKIENFQDISEREDDYLDNKFD